PRPPLPRDDGDHPRAGLAGLAPRLRPWWSRLVLLLGRPRLGRLVRLPDQQPRARSLAQPADGPRVEPRPLGDPLSHGATLRARHRDERPDRPRPPMAA